MTDYLLLFFVGLMIFYYIKFPQKRIPIIVLVAFMTVLQFFLTTPAKAIYTALLYGGGVGIAAVIVYFMDKRKKLQCYKELLLILVVEMLQG